MNDPRRLMLQRLNLAREEWYAPRRATRLLPSREAVLRSAVDHIGADTDIRYLEFGVFSGRSMSFMIRWLLNPDAEFVGFDSFEGLPGPWVANAGPAGAFDLGGRLPAITDKRVRFVKGWFQNTVGDYLDSLRDKPAKTTLVHFDADLYSSTLFLLSAFWWTIPEYYFVFDEFHNEELVALYDFAAAYPVEVEFFTACHSANGYPVQIFGRLRRTSLVIQRTGETAAA